MTDNASLQSRRVAAIPRGVGNAFPVFAERAQNAEVWDVEGKRYVDFAGGIAVLNTGHRHPKVMAAVRDQLDKFTHTCFQVLAYEPYVALAERLNALAPFKGEAKTIFFSTGAEAVENSIKIARAATGRPGVIAFTGAFHGRTMMTMSLTGKVAPYRKKFGPGVPGVYHLPFPADGVTVQESLRALEFLFRADIEPGQVAAIIIEPVQGEGGFHPAPVELLEALRKICDDHGIVMIVDEIQTGFARTGKMFGIEVSGVQPDLITVAKSLAGGFPLSGVVGKAAIMDAAEPGGLGGTYAGSPIACAAALAVLDVIEEEAARQGQPARREGQGGCRQGGTAQRHGGDLRPARTGRHGRLRHHEESRRQRARCRGHQARHPGRDRRRPRASFLRRPRQHDPHPRPPHRRGRRARGRPRQARKGADRGQRLTAADRAGLMLRPAVASSS